MSSSLKALAASALLAIASAQGVILQAQGKGAASLAFQVNTTQADANIINTKEISDNAVNECGRTILNGNIDIGENTEGQLVAKTVTQVTKGSSVNVQIAQVSQDGAGPYSCDLDQSSNADGATGQTKLDVQEGQPQNGIINLKVQMPKDMACVGASTGNVCTVRCFNNATAGPFGGCFAVQQTDTTAKKNTPANIPTAQTLENVLTQVQQNAADLPAAFKANAEAKNEEQQGVFAVKEILGDKATLTAAGPAGDVKTNGAATQGGGAAKAGKNANANNNAANSGKAKNANDNAKANANGGATQGGGAAKAGKNTSANNEAENSAKGNKNNNKNNKREVARSFASRRNLSPQN